MRGDRRALAPSPQPPGPGPASKSQGPAHGQGIGLGLTLLGLGTPPGLSMNHGPQAAFPHTSILDNFNRADSGSLGANWALLDPGGGGGYSSTPLGISGNAAFNPNTTGANKGTAYWTPSTFAGAVEAFVTVSAIPGDAWGVMVRCGNVGGIAVVWYGAIGFSNGTVGGITRTDNFSTTTVLSNPTIPNTPVPGDKIGMRVSTNASGNPVIDFWWFSSATGQWTNPGSFTDSSANKITANGNIGMMIGNANGSSVGRFDNFGGGAS